MPKQAPLNAVKYLFGKNYPELEKNINKFLKSGFTKFKYTEVQNLPHSPSDEMFGAMVKYAVMENVDTEVSNEAPAEEEGR